LVPVRIVEARSPERVVDQINYTFRVEGSLYGALEEPFLDLVAAQAGRFQRSSNWGRFRYAQRRRSCFSADRTGLVARPMKGTAHALARSRTGTCTIGHDWLASTRFARWNRHGESAENGMANVVVGRDTGSEGGGGLINSVHEWRSAVMS
jgi:hypothetical protein